MGEIKKGYKQSDIGVIPEDWEVKSVNEIFKFLSTATFSRAELSDEGEIQCLHYGDIHTKFNEFVDFNSVTLSKVTGKRSLNYALLQDGDIIMADASEDYVGLCKSIEIKNITNKRAISGLHTILLREKNSIYEKGFRSYLFLVPEVKKQFNSLATGMKVFGVSKKNLTQVLLPVPTQFEQTAIATALSDVDALISALDKKITKKQQIKQGAMQQLLTGKKRLPEFSGISEFKQTELGLIPGDWEVKKLGDIGEPIIGLTYKPENVKSEGILVLRSSNIQENKLSFDDNVFVNVEVSDRIITRNGDILICVRNGSRELIGKSAVIKGKAVGQTFGAFMSVYRTDYSNYVSHLFNSELIKMQIDQHLGATINQITNKSLSSFNIPLPPTLSEQNAIAHILTDMDNEITQLQAGRDKYKQIKAGMMQQLLTGKIRINH